MNINNTICSKEYCPLCRKQNYGYAEFIPYQRTTFDIEVESLARPNLGLTDRTEYSIHYKHPTVIQWYCGVCGFGLELDLTSNVVDILGIFRDGYHFGECTPFTRILPKPIWYDEYNHRYIYHIKDQPVIDEATKIQRLRSRINTLNVVNN